MATPFLVKGPQIVSLPTQGNGGDFNKVPKSPSPTKRGRFNTLIPTILTRGPSPINVCPYRCGKRHCRHKRGRY